MIIFGWGNTKTKDYGETYPLKCSRCNNSTYWRLVRITQWFDLFFIPIFAYETKHWILCPVCNVGFELDDDKLEHARELNEITLSYLDKKITDKEYNKKLDSYDKVLTIVEQTK